MTQLGEITRLWRAITDPAEVTRWMGDPAWIELRIGGAYFVDFGRRRIYRNRLHEVLG